MSGGRRFPLTYGAKPGYLERGKNKPNMLNMRMFNKKKTKLPNFLPKGLCQRTSLSEFTFCCTFSYFTCLVVLTLEMWLPFNPNYLVSYFCFKSIGQHFLFLN